MLRVRRVYEGKHADDGVRILVDRLWPRGLCSSDKSELIERIARMAINNNVTLVYGARDTEHNNARVLEEAVARHMKALPQP
jgi:uncharacterized protein YeaO (DUF488 family)